MTFVKNSLLILFLCVLSGPIWHTYAQFFLPGEDPASIHWQYIKSPHFKIIYPEQFHDQANRFANDLEYYFNTVFSQQEARIKNFPVIMHTESVISNAFVSWSPKRLEIITTPSQENYPSDWLTQLTLHEQVHIRQVSKLNRGFGRILSFLFGEAGYASLVGTIPFWKIEGDAVMHETAFSSSGRGRLPEFNMYFRAHLLDHPALLSYDKAVLGSYKHFIPDWYKVGYPFALFQTLYPDTLAFGKHTYFEARPLQKYSLHTFQASLNRFKYLYDMNLYAIDSSYTSNIFSYFSPHYMNYRYPQYLNNRIITEKTSLSQTAGFMMHAKNPNEMPLFKAGLRIYEGFSANENQLVWDEIVRDPRWDYRNYSIIRSYDFNRGRITDLTKKSRYFTPVLSPNGKYLAVTRQENNYISALCLLDSKTGDLINILLRSNAVQFTRPGWINDSLIAFISTNNSGNSLLTVNLNNQSVDTIIPRTIYKIDQPVGWYPYIIYRDTRTGIDNLFAVHIATKKRFQITNEVYGAFDPSVNATLKQLVYARYTPEGFRLALIELDTSSWYTPRTNTNPFISLADSLRDKMQRQFPLLERKDSLYDSKTYRKSLHLFNPHSWAPFYFDFSQDFADVKVSPGITLFSQNHLNTAVTTLAYTYENNMHYFIPRFVYSGLYPVFEFYSRIGGRPQYYDMDENTDYTPQGIRQYYYLKTYVPLHYHKGPFLYAIQPGVQLEYRNSLYQQNLELYQGQLYISPYIKLYRLEDMAKRDMKSPSGFVLQAYYTETPVENAYLGSMFTLRGNVLFRGPLPHHHVSIRAGWEKQFPNNFLLSSYRNYPVRAYRILLAEETSVFSADYLLPLAYPDFSIGPVAYFKRIRLNLFYDFGHTSNRRELVNEKTVLHSGNISSAGYDLTFDFHLLRFVLPFNAGLRHAYRIEDKKHYFEFLFSIDTSVL